jgi:hypothetical protein
MHKIKRPRYNGKWTDIHVCWVIDRFKHRQEEIASRDIQKAHGRQKKGEPDLNAQDFRNLMRLVVKNKLARVSNGFSGSFHKVSSYRIRLVSEDNPYVKEQLLDQMLFHLSLVNLPPKREEFSTNFSDIQVADWMQQHQIAWDREKYWWLQVCKAFHRYQYSGGDLEDLPHCFDLDAKENFVLRVNQLICQYVAIKLGWEELKMCSYKWDFPDGSFEETIWSSPEHLFVDMLQATSICRFLAYFSPEEKVVQGRTKADHCNKIIKSFEDSEPIPIENVNLVTREYNKSQEAIHCNFAGGSRFQNHLKNSKNPAIRKAVYDWQIADIATFKYTERMYRND